MEMFVIPSPKRVEVIESEADIARSPEDVFDYCSDPRTSLNGTFSGSFRGLGLDGRDLGDPETMSWRPRSAARARSASGSKRSGSTIWGGEPVMADGGSVQDVRCSPAGCGNPPDVPPGERGAVVKGNERVIGTLNDLLGLELSAINQYLAHSKMCQNWGYERLAERFRQVSLEEMKDAEEIIERVLFLEGMPKMGRPPPTTIGPTVPEQLRAALETEREALKLLREGIATALEVDDQATREFLASRLADEEGHLDWLETQLSLIDSVGEANYLAQQLRT